LLALAFVLWGWGLLAPYYREFWAKLGVGLFRFLAAGSAVMSRAEPAPPNTPLLEQWWVVTTLVAIAGFLLWEFVGAVGDHKYKAAKEKKKAEVEQEIEALAQDKDDAMQQSLRLGRMVTHLRRLVDEKLQRVKQVVRESTATRGSLPETRRALDPQYQIGVILETLASLLRIEVISAGGHHDQNFRIGLYAEKDGQLAPIDAFDLKTYRHDPFTSFRAHADYFRLDNTQSPSQAVRCVREGRMLIVPDCANHPGFQFFHPQQQNYLRSMVAYPLPDFSPDGSTPVRAALLIDTDVAGYFQEEDEELIAICLREFAARIELEYAIRGLTS
jgi:hypothetical protein